MKNYKFYSAAIFFVPFLLSFPLQAEEARPSKQETASKSASPKDPKEQKMEIAKISEAFGHLMGKNIESLGFKFDIQYVVKGLKDAAAGKDSPMSEMECIQAISTAQEEAFKEQSKVNLEKAEQFLKKNNSSKEVVSMENGKVQYKVEKQGKGDAVQPDFAPVIRYVGKFLDGTVFGSSKEDEPIALEETIPGLKQGMVGMKEGEKRTIYIHPDLAYGTRGSLPPNSLLTFEIEVVKANSIGAQDKEGVSPKSKQKTPEIALPDQIEHMR